LRAGRTKKDDFTADDSKAVGEKRKRRPAEVKAVAVENRTKKNRVRRHDERVMIPRKNRLRSRAISRCM
jgi:hypothetical protein